MVASGLDPNALEGEPENDYSLDWVWAAFWRLTTCRGVGMAPGQIPWTAVAQYGREQCGIDDPDELDDFWDLIHAMDLEFLKPKEGDN
ncbi:phage tail assembly chaperone [Azospirillum baldaniorum]|uniref:phage tail assembly chaperone n=1 Tax=Azospirillum baldaniorum TaxID=1064539 RepID=UPI003F70EFED